MARLDGCKACHLRPSVLAASQQRSPRCQSALYKVPTLPAHILAVWHSHRTQENRRLPCKTANLTAHSHTSVVLSRKQRPAGVRVSVRVRGRATAMTNQDVVVPDMGIAAAAALPPPGLFACRGVAGAVSSLRGTYGGLGLPGGAAADGGEFRSPVAAAANAPPGRTSCTSRVVEAIRASSPARCPAVDEYDAWTVSSSPRAPASHSFLCCVPGRRSLVALRRRSVRF